MKTLDECVECKTIGKSACSESSHYEENNALDLRDLLKKFLRAFDEFLTNKEIKENFIETDYIIALNFRDLLKQKLKKIDVAYYIDRRS